jgi:hypothetical protein
MILGAISRIQLRRTEGLLFSDAGNLKDRK